MPTETEGVFYVSVIGMRGTYRIAAKWPMRIEVFHLCSGELLQILNLREGEAWDFQAPSPTQSYLHRVKRT